jgi:hypothetical protein
MVSGLDQASATPLVEALHCPPKRVNQHHSISLCRQMKPIHRVYPEPIGFIGIKFYRRNASADARTGIGGVYVTNIVA